MNTRHIQTFLMVSAAFFAMNAPVRSKSGDMLAAAVSHTAQIASAGVGLDRETDDDRSDAGPARF